MLKKKNKPPATPLGIETLYCKKIKNDFTWDHFIKMVEANYPKATPEKLLKHVKQTYGENILKSSWKYETVDGSWDYLFDHGYLRKTLCII